MKRAERLEGAAITQTAPERATEPAQGRSRTHPVVLGIASGLLLWCAFPPASWGWLAWVALVPLFLLVAGEYSAWSAYAGAWVGGLVFWLLAIQWVKLTDPTAWLAWLVMAAFLSLWWPAFLALARVGVRRLRLPLMVAAPIVWVALEFIRAFVLTGFPWYYLAHSQYRYVALIQSADFAGALGLSFLVAMANACLVDLLTRPLFVRAGRGPRFSPAQSVRLGVLSVLLAGNLGYGFYRLSTAQFEPGPRVALLQSNIKQVFKNSREPDQILAEYIGLIEQAVRAGDKLDLIIWPETSYPYQFLAIDPALDDKAIDREASQLASKMTPEFWRMKLRNVSEHLHGWADQLQTPMLVGTLFYDFARSGLSRFNSAVLFQPGVAAIETYFKLHLVPFGEFVPLVESCPWLVNLTPYRGSDHVPGLDFGREPRWFDLGRYRLATAICFEDTVPHLVRRFFAEAPGGRQPDVLVNMSNDGWFGWSEELDMHLAVSVFRSVENRVPLVRAVNTGISALVDGNGRIVASLPKNREQVLSVVVPLDSRQGLYTHWGDWLGIGCVLVAVGLLPLALAQALAARRKTRASAA